MLRRRPFTAPVTAAALICECTQRRHSTATWHVPPVTQEEQQGEGSPRAGPCARVAKTDYSVARAAHGRLDVGAALYALVQGARAHA